MLTRVLCPGALAAAIVAAALAAATRAAEQELPRSVLPPATRGPLRIAFSPAGDRAFVTEADTGTIAVVDVARGELLRRMRTGGTEPRGIAVAPDGTLAVANRFSGSVVRLDPATGRRLAAARLRGEPSELLLSRDGRTLFVSLGQRDEAAVLAWPELRLRARIPAPGRPEAMALTPDGRTLLIAGRRSGEVAAVDTVSLREVRRFQLTGVNLRGIAVAPDGRTAWVTGQIPANSRVTAEPLDIWTNTLFVIDLARGQAPGAEGWIDFPLAASPDPDGIVALGPDRVAVTLSGSDQVLLVRTPGPYLRTYDPVVERRVAVGARPRGIAVAPGGRSLWVAGELDGSLTVLDAASFRLLRRIELGPPPGRDLRLRGRYLFGNAALTRGRQFTCNSCHPDGGSDGLVWQFAHVPDGLALRNSRSLRGGITRTAPFRWTGYEPEIEAFLQDEITGLLRGPRQDHRTLHAFWNLLDRFPLPPNPYRREDGRLTAQAERGRALFEGKAGCISCHDGELRGGTGRKAWIGTTPPGLPLDVPHLVGVHDSPPYLHDGRAATLEAIFTRHNPDGRHGNAHRLTPRELADLLRYLREL